MKSLRLSLTIFVLFAATIALAQTSAQKSFDQMKSLVGSWEGKNSQGENLQVDFRSTGGDSALMSTITSAVHHQQEMVSMIHMDGANRLILTHYCSSGNQPRMSATTSADGKTITFDFFDGTNIGDKGHMQRVVFTMIDANHHTEEWTFNAGLGKEMKELFDLHRAEVAQK
jgi:hypothetical protein